MIVRSLEERPSVAHVGCRVRVPRAVWHPAEPFVERSRALIRLEHPEGRRRHPSLTEAVGARRDQSSADAASLSGWLNVQAVDVSHLTGVVISVLGRPVLAEPGYALAAPRRQHPSAQGRLPIHNLCPVPDAVRGQPLAVVVLGDQNSIRSCPSRYMEVPQRLPVPRICDDDLHAISLPDIPRSGTGQPPPARGRQRAAFPGRDVHNADTYARWSLLD